MIRAVGLKLLAVGAAFALALLASSVSFAQGPPPPTPAHGPPFGLPDSAPPPFSKGKGLGPGKTSAKVSYNCLGVIDEVAQQGTPYSFVQDALEIDVGRSTVFLDGSASSDLVGGGVLFPTHGASASVETGSLSLQPFDFCASSSGSALDSVVTGLHLGDPTASGIVDVEFHFQYQATLELDDSGSGARFTAYTATVLEVLGLSLDSFEVSADGQVLQVPPGLLVEDRSVGTHHVYLISGTYAVEGQLLFGPGVTNVVKTTFTAGSEIDGYDLQRGKLIAGFAAAEALDTISYEIISLDPNVVFLFVEEQEPPAAEQ
jgi:hypothetical protein